MIAAIVLINVERGMVNETAERLLSIEHVAEVYSVTGEYDLIAIVRVANYDDMAGVVTSEIVKLPTITKTHTMMSFKCYSRDDLQQAWDIGIE